VATTLLNLQVTGLCTFSCIQYENKNTWEIIARRGCNEAKLWGHKPIVIDNYKSLYYQCPPPSITVFTYLYYTAALLSRYLATSLHVTFFGLLFTLVHKDDSQEISECFAAWRVQDNFFARKCLLLHLTVLYSVVYV